MRDANAGKGPCPVGQRPAVETAGYPYKVGLRRLGTYQSADAVPLKGYTSCAPAVVARRLKRLV